MFSVSISSRSTSSGDAVGGNGNTKCGLDHSDCNPFNIDTTSRSATVRLSSSQPIRVWTWLNRDGNHRRFIDARRATNTPVVMIDNLVPAEQCKLTLVIGGPHGQQAVLQHELATKGW